MSAEENKKLVRQIGQAWNETAGDLSKVRAYYEKYSGPGYVHHSLTKGDQNAEQRIQDVLMSVPAIPDLTYALDDLVAEGDKVVVRYTARATHKGAFMGIPATGKQWVAKGVVIYRLAGGKIVESWEFIDALGILAQLGVMPARPAPK